MEGWWSLNLAVRLCNDADHFYTTFFCSIFIPLVIYVVEYINENICLLGIETSLQWFSVLFKINVSLAVLSSIRPSTWRNFLNISMKFCIFTWVSSTNRLDGPNFGNSYFKLGLSLQLFIVIGKNWWTLALRHSQLIREIGKAWNWSFSHVLDSETYLFLFFNEKQC